MILSLLASRYGFSYMLPFLLWLFVIVLLPSNGRGTNEIPKLISNDIKVIINEIG